jgi:FkbM family methyltransferase
MDVGAFVGDWARICLDIFPSSRIACIEPQDAPQQQLQRLAAANPRVHVLQTLLGRTVIDDVPFLEIGSGSSVLAQAPIGHGKPMTTIDALIDSGVCNPPELLKLDVQGYEMEVLEGYRRNFDSCQVIQCEVSLMPLNEGSPLIHEMIDYLYARGFMMFEVTELIRAPSDGALWQVDAMFCRVDSPLRSQRALESRVAQPSAARENYEITPLPRR